MSMKDNVQQLWDARRRLAENAEREKAEGIDYETEEYLQLNAEVAAAEACVPWWLRW